jgi:hypothetical protein
VISDEQFEVARPDTPGSLRYATLLGSRILPKRWPVAS